VEFGASAKLLELLKEVAPGVTRVAVLRDLTIGIVPARRPSGSHPAARGHPGGCQPWHGIGIVTKVLYIEDNDDNVYMLKMRLELLRDFEVLAAGGGEKGCEMAAVEQPDIILMDLEMPVVDGWEATRRIRKLATSQSSPCPHMRSPASAKKRSPRDATSSIVSR